jgi:predicted transcriptional regulator
MSEQTADANGSDFPRLGGADSPMGIAYRVLSVRMSDDTRAQLEVLAQLNDRSVTEETRHALEHWVVKSKSDPSVLKRAETVRAEIEREAETKRNAITAIFGSAEPAGNAPKVATKAATRESVKAGTTS